MNLFSFSGLAIIFFLFCIFCLTFSVSLLKYTHIKPWSDCSLISNTFTQDLCKEFSTADAARQVLFLCLHALVLSLLCVL